MSKWCDTCHRNELAGEWKSCGPDCPVFGKSFDDLAKSVVATPAPKEPTMKVKDLAAVRWSVVGDVQFAIVYDVETGTLLADGCSMEYAIKHYGDWNVYRICAEVSHICLHVRKGE